MLNDLRLIIKSIVRTPVFSIVVIATLSLGIGSAAAIYSLTEWVLFRSERLPANVFLVGGKSSQSSFMPMRLDLMAREYRARASGVAEFSSAVQNTDNISVNSEPVANGWLGVSGDVLGMLNARITRGRNFSSEELESGNGNVVIVTHRFWQKFLGGADDALGKTILIGRTPCVVIGILDEKSELPRYFSTNVIRPFKFTVNQSRPWEYVMYLLLRLKPGVGKDDVLGVLKAAQIVYPASIARYYRDDEPSLLAVRDINRGFRKEVYWILVGAVSFLYAISCLNVSNLLLVRLLSRRRETAIRVAVGASRFAVGRLLFLESFVHAFIGAAGGALVTYWLFPVLISFTDDSGAFFNADLGHVGYRSIALLGVLALVTSGFVSLIPLVQFFRSDIVKNIKDGESANEGLAQRRLRSAILVLQVAMAVVLLFGATLMVCTFRNLHRVDLGFSAEDRIEFNVSFPKGYAANQTAWLSRLKAFKAELESLPGVEAVGYASDFMFSSAYYPSQTLTGKSGEEIKSVLLPANDTFLAASGLRLIRGEWLQEGNMSQVLVSESLAKRLWGDQNPVGQWLRPTNLEPGDEGWRVRGIVADFKTAARESPYFYIYGPERWNPFGINTFAIKCRPGSTDTVLQQIQKKLYAFDPALIVYQPHRFEQLLDRKLAAEHLANSMFKVLGAIALSLTVVGQFSAAMFAVHRRRTEFGIRIALGATPRSLMILVFKNGVRLSLLGLVIGAGVSLALSRTLSSLLFEASLFQPMIILTVSAVAIGVSVLASLVPAALAFKTNPAVLLRTT